ncbi:hypothetical protein CH330_09225 [candidate division WOR-3 bacterium JGI_Cruoil_03_51_56]|uniref:Ribosomal RNA small subunit methyltransferase E n=1 Tax=candidate division WOR-3 bacterium JGI_Cruoil_03_51_56 TaxID=1973747 RepID=A0A235BNV2_UNCW3|nr:MAG: hypothetical protein CH330_09225 [candidate division WOR-3 bacterium JGI_Cruoil_03_51_56]
MELFFLAGSRPVAGNVIFDGAEAHHISRVLRHQPGDRIYATDGLGAEYELELRRVEPARVIGAILSSRFRPREPGCRLTIAPGIIKGDRLRRVVEGITQLGVSEVIPLRTRRTVAGLSEKRLDRLRKVAVGAMKCSTRTVLPRICDAMELNELANRIGGYDLALVAYEEEQNLGLADVLIPGAESVLLVVGPEGGFEPEEVNVLVAAGARCFSMGPRRFRAETAGVVAVALVLQLLGELGGSKSLS